MRPATSCRNSIWMPTVWITMTVILLVQPCPGAPPDEVRPLIRAHAHNDYAHQRPLLDALEQGFCNVEVDVFLVHGRLLVGHDEKDLQPDRTLEQLYLQPLATRVAANAGNVFSAQDAEFTLMIDFKSEAEPTYQVLKKELVKYHSMLSSVRDGKLEKRAVTIVISGNRPIETVHNEKERWAAIDGRLTDLESEVSPHMMPWISDNWTKNFKWNGDGHMPTEERRKLDSLVQRAHQRGRRLRWWAAPDREEVWKVFVDAEVDLINTDNLAGLARLLNSKR